MYGPVHVVSFAEVEVSAAQDLFELLAPADAALAIHLVKFAQSSDYGDAAAEALDVLMKRVTGAPTSGSGGSTPTPTALSPSAAASGVTIEANNTTQLSGGTQATLLADAWNVQLPFEYIPPPEQRPIISPSTRFVVELPNAPGDAITLSGLLMWEEIGG